MLRKILTGFAVVIVLLIVAAFVVPYFIPTDTLKAEIASRAKAATGRDLVIKGDVSFSILPTLGVTAKDVSFANAPGGQAKQMVTLKELVVEAKVLPLISGRYEVDRFVLVDPVINLEVDKTGKPNWQFGKPMAAGKAPAAAKPAPQPSAPAGKAAPSEPGGGMAGIRLGDVRIVNGTVTYSDMRTGERQRIDKANLSVSFPDLSSPISVKGGLVWNKQPVKLEAKVDKPGAVAEGGSTPAKLSLQSDLVSVNFGGAIRGGKEASASGKLDLDIPSLRKLAAWTGKPLTMKGSGFGPFKVTGNVALSGATIKLDDIVATGKLAVSTAGKVPDITAELTVPKLDLNPYIAGGGAAKGAAAAPSGGGKPAAGKPAAGKPAGGAKAAGGWSREPIDTSGLRAVNASLDLTAKEILYQRIKIDSGKLKVRLAGGKLQANLVELKLYGGSGSGTVVLDGSGAVPAVSEQFKLTGLQARPFLAAAANYDGLSGLANIDVNVTGRGRSQYDIVKSLDGKGAVTFRDGAIRGTNLIGMACSFNPEALMKSLGKDKETKFSELNGTYVINDGMLKNNDLQLKSPLVRVTGKGTANLPAQTVNYRVEPKAVASCQGQGGAFAKKGITVPVIVEGPWASPSWKLDLAAIKPEDLKKGAKEVGKSIKGIIEGAKKKGGGAAKPEEKIKEGLKGLLGK
jgi:AsmA protein